MELDRETGLGSGQIHGLEDEPLDTTPIVKLFVFPLPAAIVGGGGGG